MKLLVGLGNPGPQYVRSRHNLGFVCLDAVAEGRGIKKWKEFKGGVIAEEGAGEGKLLYFKPQQFMNTSGIPLRQVMEYYGIAPEDVCIIMDDVYIAPGTARIRKGGGDGGHNGLRSILQHVTESFWRVRIGAGLYEQHPDRRQHMPDLEEFVLQPLPKHEEEKVRQLIDKLVPNLIGWLEHGDLKEKTVHLT